METGENPRKLVSPAVARRLLQEAGIRPSRSRGQNFLIDANVLRIITDAARLSPSDIVVEVGAGLGALTQALVEIGCPVFALESDSRLVHVLEKQLGASGNLTLLHADAARFDFSSLMPQDPPETVKMVSNLPYQIASSLLVRCIQQYPWLSEYVVMVQNEVAGRLAGRPGGKEYSAATVKVQVRASVTRVAGVSRNSFYPRPKVDSAVLRLERHRPDAAGGEPEEFFDRLVSAAFSQRRKILVNALSSAAGLGIDAAGVKEALLGMGRDPASRAEGLTPGEFLELAGMLRAGRP